MSKNLLKKIINGEDILHTSFNTIATWSAGTFANIVSNSLFRFNLNQYNSTSHAMAGVIGGTLTSRIIDDGLKGLALALGAANVLNVGWECYENLYVFKDVQGLTSIDTISDVAMVYSGILLGFLGEKAKDYMNRDKIKREEKWLL
jgi:hypothetical protein